MSDMVHNEASRPNLTGKQLLEISGVKQIAEVFHLQAYGDVVCMQSALRGLKFGSTYIPRRRVIRGPPDLPFEWTTDQVVEWLEMQGLGALRRAFVTHRVDGEVLFRMSIDDFGKFEPSVLESQSQLEEAISRIRALDCSRIDLATHK
jgi:hypothetical protein